MFLIFLEFRDYVIALILIDKKTFFLIVSTIYGNKIGVFHLVK